MEKTLKKVIRILEGTPYLKAYALIGGLAVGGWITPRATKDIDMLVDLSRTDTDTVGVVLRNFINAGFKCSLKTGGPEEDIKFCIKAVSKEGVPVDIIFASRKWEAEIAEECLHIEIMKGVSLPVVQPEGLIVLKLRAGSFQDVADVSRLLTDADYDIQKLLALAKRARVDKRLVRLMERLGLPFQ